MRHAEIEEVIAAYALDSLGPEDRRDAEHELVEHLPGCASCQSLYRELRETVGDLALATEPARVPRALEQRIADALQGEKRAPADPGTRAAGWRRHAVAVVAAAALAALGAWNVSLTSTHRGDRARIRQALAALGDPAAARATLVDRASGAPSVWVALSPDGRVTLVGADLPRVPRDKVLELWLMRGGLPVPAGVFRPGSGLTIVILKVDPRVYDAAAITVETAPDGSPKPTGDMIFFGAVRLA
jgi:anti-sigma-K factor RskA